MRKLIFGIIVFALLLSAGTAKAVLTLKEKGDWDDWWSLDYAGYKANYVNVRRIYDKENQLVYGGVSNGWFNGNGVRVTMHSVSDNVLSKNTDWMNGISLPLQIKQPTLKKCVMKGEIYRLGVQWYKNGNRLFTTIL